MVLNLGNDLSVVTLGRWGNLVVDIWRELPLAVIPRWRRMGDLLIRVNTDLEGSGWAVILGLH
jgi:hypothetical protein